MSSLYHVTSQHFLIVDIICVSGGGPHEPEIVGIHIVDKAVNEVFPSSQ